jgi:predicted RNA-binding protein with PIN domain
MPYLVDGNNLAHVLGLSQGGLADREACSRIVAEFCRSRGARATIIFDGPAPLGGRADRQGPRVRIRFSEALSADDAILRWLSESKTPSDFTVVTSDKSLGDKARHRGATVERAHEFSRRLAPSRPLEQTTDERTGVLLPRRLLARKPRSSGAASYKPGQTETAEEVGAWLAVFDPGRKSTP